MALAGRILLSGHVSGLGGIDRDDADVHCHPEGIVRTSFSGRVSKAHANALDPKVVGVGNGHESLACKRTSIGPFLSFGTNPHIL